MVLPQKLTKALIECATANITLYESNIYNTFYPYKNTNKNSIITRDLIENMTQVTNWMSVRYYIILKVNEAKSLVLHTEIEHHDTWKDTFWFMCIL